MDVLRTHERLPSVTSGFQRYTWSSLGKGFGPAPHSPGCLGTFKYLPRGIVTVTLAGFPRAGIEPDSLFYGRSFEWLIQGHEMGEDNRRDAASLPAV